MPETGSHALSSSPPGKETTAIFIVVEHGSRLNKTTICS
jgi:hypothetical protein